MRHLFAVLAVLWLPVAGAAETAAPSKPPAPSATPALTTPSTKPTEAAKPAAKVDTSAKDAKPDRKPASGKAFLWEVKSAGNVIHLFGTIHVGRRDFYPLPDAVEAALKDAAVLVVEADISDQSGLADLPPLMMYMPPNSIEKHIPPELFERLNAQATRLKLPSQAVRSMRPFMVAGLLAVSEYSRIGYDASQGVDAYLIRTAKADMKPVLELESVKGQVQLLAGMPEPLQVAFLDNTVASLERGGSADQVIGVINAWQSGDATLMQEVADNANKGMRDMTQLDDLLIHGRNAEMLKKIEGYLKGTERHFVAVGSLHLTGPRGLVALLKAKGYEVTQK